MSKGRRKARSSLIRREISRWGRVRWAFWAAARSAASGGGELYYRLKEKREKKAKTKKAEEAKRLEELSAEVLAEMKKMKKRKIEGMSPEEVDGMSEEEMVEVMKMYRDVEDWIGEF